MTSRRSRILTKLASIGLRVIIEVGRLTGSWFWSAFLIAVAIFGVLQIPLILSTYWLCKPLQAWMDARGWLIFGAAVLLNVGAASLAGLIVAQFEHPLRVLARRPTQKPKKSKAASVKA